MIIILLEVSPFMKLPSPLIYLFLKIYDSGSGLAVGSYGNLLVSLECPLGRYPITTCILKLLNHLIKVCMKF